VAPRTLSIEHRYFIGAPPTKVFRALTDPGWLTRWFLVGARIKPEAGTRYSFRWRGGYAHTADVVEAVPNRRLTLSWPNRVGRVTKITRVTFGLSRKGHGTLLRLRHVGYPTARAWLPTYGATESGWAYFLTNLKSVLEHGYDLRSPHDA
jgi:uncharacterized protein YndB with AHSA1/START domain